MWMSVLLSYMSTSVAAPSAAFHHRRKGAATGGINVVFVNVELFGDLSSTDINLFNRGRFRFVATREGKNGRIFLGCLCE